MSGPSGDHAAAPAVAAVESQSVGQVLRNRRFLSLWLAQVASQVGGNMVLYGLTVLVTERTASVSAVSLLLLTFLVPAVVFSAIAGVFVDRFDRRLILIVANVLRGVIFVAMVVLDDNLILIYILNIASPRSPPCSPRPRRR